MKRTIYLGLSSAASWAWGVSFLVTYTLIHDKGIVPFIIWAFFNSIAIPLFGYIFTRFLDLKDMLENNKLLMYFVLVVQFFSIIVNLQAIYQMATLIGLESNGATLLSIICGLVFIISIHKNGFNRVLYSNVIQWLIILVVLIFLISKAYINQSEIINLNIGHTTNIIWSFYAGALLLCSPFVDLQGWMRAKTIESEKRNISFIYSGIFFSFYMILILALSNYKLTSNMGLILLFLVIMISTSTIQPNAYALKSNLRFGGAIAVAACLLWPLLKTLGILNLWTFLATFRAVVVITMFITIFIQRKIKYNRQQTNK